MSSINGNCDQPEYLGSHTGPGVRGGYDAILHTGPHCLLGNELLDDVVHQLNVINPSFYKRTIDFSSSLEGLTLPQRERVVQKFVENELESQLKILYQEEGFCERLNSQRKEELKTAKMAKNLLIFDAVLDAPDILEGIVNPNPITGWHATKAIVKLGILYEVNKYISKLYDSEESAFKKRYPEFEEIPEKLSKLKEVIEKNEELKKQLGIPTNN